VPPTSTPRTRDHAFEPTRRQRLAIGIVVLCVSLALGLLLGEALVRMFAPHPTHTPMFDRVNGLKSYTPNASGRVFVPGSYDTIQTTGPERFRGPQSYDAQPAPGVIRIVTIGDSFTFGDGANDDESYPRDLAQMLGSGVEVINAGVANTGTGEQALYFDEYVRNFHPNIVILGVVGNDPIDDANTPVFHRDPSGALAPEPENRRGGGRFWRISRALRHIPPMPWLFGHSQLLALADYELHKAAGGPQGNDRLVVADYDEAHLKLTEDEIAWLASRVAGSGAQLVVVYLPASVSTYQTTGHPYEEWRQQEADLANACATAAMTARVPFLDLRVYMRQFYQRTHQTLYHHGLDEHPNAAGYRAFAQGIADFLRRSRVVR